MVTIRQNDGLLSNRLNELLNDGGIVYNRKYITHTLIVFGFIDGISYGLIHIFFQFESGIGVQPVCGIAVQFCLCQNFNPVVYRFGNGIFVAKNNPIAPLIRFDVANKSFAAIFA